MTGLMSNSISDREAYARWLQWQAEMGADEAISAHATDRMAQPAAPETPRQATPAASPGARARSPEQRGIQATIVASPPAAPEADLTWKVPPQECNSLEEIHAALDAMHAFPLRRTAAHTVFTDGNPNARVMLIGEAPGREEDMQGKPFVGRAGQLLDRMLAAIRLSRHNEGEWDSVLITNVLFWRPPGNRKPTEAELAFCEPWVKRAIALVKPAVIVCLGGTPTQRLTQDPAGILRQRGKWRNLGIEGLDAPVPMLPMLHPAYLLRQPAQKRLAWRDLLALRDFIDEHRGAREN